jgi:hypothetical protein
MMNMNIPCINSSSTIKELTIVQETIRFYFRASIESSICTKFYL